MARLGDHVDRLGLGTVMVEDDYVLQRAPEGWLDDAVDQAACAGPQGGT